MKELSRRVRVHTLQMTYAAGSGHPGGSMSEADLLVALYFGGILRHRPEDPKWADRDRFVLSKGHCCPGLYAVLGMAGYFPPAEFAGFRKVGRLLQGHSDVKVPGVEMSAGSLGQGLSFGNGCALAARLDGKDYRTYVMLGDGECQEGQVWEAALTSSHRRLDDVVAIVDANGIQIDGYTKDVKDLEPLPAKFAAFGWHVVEIDGHDFSQIFKAFDEARSTDGKPTAIIARTVKGKGVSFMEDKAEYHGRALTKDEMARALPELGGGGIAPWGGAP
ncbi:MAG: transketolase [Methanobacteriota archaeon]